MINALHLLWIIPISCSFGAFCLGMCIAASNRDDWKDDDT